MKKKRTGDRSSGPPPKGKTASPKNKNLSPGVLVTGLLLFVLALSIASIYSNTLQSPFIFDSVLNIKNNANIRLSELTAKGLTRAAFDAVDPYRPVSNLSFALNYYIHGYDVTGYHLVNILIHISTAFLIYFFVKTTLQTPSMASKREHTFWLPFLTALIWAVHPVQTQSVTYVVQRMNSMAAMFYIFSLLLYAKGRLARGKKKTWALFAGCVITGLLALGSKQIAGTLPFFIILYEWFFFQGLRGSWFKRHYLYWAGLLAVFVLAALIYLGLHPVARLSTEYAYQDFSILHRALTQFRVVIYYLSLMVFPHPSRLNLDYDFSLSYSLIEPITTLLSFGIILGLLGLGIYFAKKERLLSFCILWFFGTLVIESSVIPLALVFEHRLYLPSMGVCLVAVLLGSRYVKSRRVKIGAVCLVALVFSVWTYQRNEVWKDDVVFWRDCASKSPEKGRPYLNLGVALRERGKFDESIKAFYKALQFDPGDEKVHFNLGVALEKQGKTDEAIKYYLNALKIKEDFADAHNNLGIALVNQGKYDEAIAHHLEAIRIRPKYARAYNSLGVALEKQGNPAEAVAQYKKALELSPDYTLAYYNLAGAYMRLGDFDNAIPNYYEALRLDPNYSRAHYNLGVALLRQGKPREAAFHFAETLRIDPNDLRARRALQLLSR